MECVNILVTIHKLRHIGYMKKVSQNIICAYGRWGGEGGLKRLHSVQYSYFKEVNYFV